jgi:hypothetical protein
MRQNNVELWSSDKMSFDIRSNQPVLKKGGASGNNIMGAMSFDNFDTFNFGNWHKF